MANLHLRSAFWPLMAVGVLLLIGVGCAARLPGGQVARAVPTPSRTPRPTFTPFGGAVEPAGTPAEVVRGQLPPGVTAVAPDATDSAGLPEGSTNLVLFATPTGQPAPGVSPQVQGGAPQTTPGAAGAVRTPFGTAQSAVRTQPAPSAVPAGPSATPRPTPYVVVNGITVAGRRGPASTFELIGEVQQGQKLMILARTPNSEWWEVCCISNQPAWVPGNVVAAEGPVEVAPTALVPPTPTATATLTPAPTLTPSPTPAPPFDIARGPEFPIKRDDGVLVVWAKVYEGPSDNQRPLAGYQLKVFRNGVDVSKGTLSHAKKSGFDDTGPSEGSYLYNLKFEMDFGGEANWEMYLARPDGSRVSPVTKFTTMGDSYRNLTVYIAYLLAR